MTLVATVEVQEPRPPVARLPLAALGAGTALLLLAFAGRYGYHRDELYFLRAGRELAFGYVDQPPLTPLLARLMDELVPGSLVALRLPSALAAGLLVLVTGLIAREFGGRDHTTVIHAVEKIGAQMQERRQIYDQVTDLIGALKNGGGR